jgi:hypothetical protein
MLKQQLTALALFGVIVGNSKQADPLQVLLILALRFGGDNKFVVHAFFVLGFLYFG